MREQADESAQAYYDKTMEVINNQLCIDAQNAQAKYFEATGAYVQEYEAVMADYAAQVADYGVKAKELLAAIDDLRSKESAAIEARKRDMEKEIEKDFYRIQIPESDLHEIEKLREVLPYLRDKDALNKVIYKVYYENPVNDMIGRVVGKKQGGIYKITNIENGMCYVGQAVNFANRWKQHIKRGVGAEPITHNKLYPAMQKEGVENFTFEVIEECPSNKLNEREDYWQNYFGAKEFGYSIK